MLGRGGKGILIVCGFLVRGCVGWVLFAGMGWSGAVRWLERVSEWEKCSGIANLLV